MAPLLVAALVPSCRFSWNHGKGKPGAMHATKTGAAEESTHAAVLATYWNITPSSRSRDPELANEPSNCVSEVAYANVATLDKDRLTIFYEPGTLFYVPKAVMITEVVEKKVGDILDLKQVSDAEATLRDETGRVTSTRVLWMSFDQHAHIADSSSASSSGTDWLQVRVDKRCSTIEVPVGLMGTGAVQALTRGEASVIVAFVSSVAPEFRAPSISVLSPIAEGE